MFYRWTYFIREVIIINLDLVLVVGIMTLAAFVLRTLSFGLGLTASPLLLFVLDPVSVVIVLVSVPVILTGMLVWETRNQIDRKTIIPLGISAVIGTSFGILFVKNIESSILAIVISLVVIFMAILIISNIKFINVVSNKIIYFISIPVAALISSTGMGTPVLVAILLPKFSKINLVRGYISIYLLFVYATAALGYLISGLVQTRHIQLTALCILPSIFGYLAGKWFSNQLKDTVMRKVIVGFIIISSSITLFKEFYNMFA